jgi:hypothetical protein
LLFGVGGERGVRVVGRGGHLKEGCLATTRGRAGA